MSKYYGTYDQYLGNQRCCNLRTRGEQGIVGPTGEAIIGPRGPTGPQGDSLTGPTGRGCKGATGPQGPQGPQGAKTFIIEHPTDIDRYLVHVCLEGPEAGVYYRGKDEIINGTNVTINLPNYASNIANEFTVQITGIYDGKLKNYCCSEIVNNSFDVYGENGKFYWTAYGKRHNIDVEPLKNNVNPQGNGPYLWI